MADDDILEGAEQQDPHRVAKRKEREERTLSRFKASRSGLHRVFGKHFGEYSLDADLTSDCGGSSGVVAGDHCDADAEGS